MSSTPRFSVVIPAYNASRFIREAIRSVALARGADFLDYVFVLDDGSTDDTIAVARAALSDFCLPGVVLLNGVNLGVGETRRRAYEAVESPVIMCVDADDLVRRDRFVDALQKLADPMVMLVGGDVLPFYESGPSNFCRTRLPVAGHDILAANLFFCPIWSGASSFRRSVLNSIHHPVEPIGEDWLFAHRVIQAFGPGAVANTGSVLIEHRRYPTQVTSSPIADTTSLHAVWSEILSESLGLHALPSELELHAKYSPYYFAPTPSPTAADMALWFDWTDKLIDHAVAANYAPVAVSRRIHQINAELMQVALARPEAFA